MNATANADCRKGGFVMPVMDEFKEEREALKHGTPKQKFAYFLDYYKWHVIVALAVIGFAGSLIYQAVTCKEVVALSVTRTLFLLSLRFCSAGVITQGL